MTRISAVVLPSLLAITACGSDPIPPVELPNAEMVRSSYGLVPNSCYLYNLLGQGFQARIDIAGPNDLVVSGKTVYVRKYSRVDIRTIEEYFETTDTGELRLLRYIAQDTDRRYAEPSTPLFARYAFDKQKNPILEVGERFETVSAPEGLPEERHEWTVVDDATAVMTPDGPTTAYDLQYRINGGSNSQYLIVPGFGVASFVDFNQITHQVCDARVCNEAGECTGAASCNDLMCP